MTRIFKEQVDLFSRAQTKALAPGSPEGWETLGEGYTELAKAIGNDVKVRSVPNMRVPGVSIFNKADETIYVDSDILGVNPNDLNMNDNTHQVAFIEFHGLFLHDYAHAKHSLWSHDFEEGKDSLASSLEDVRAEYRLVSSRASSKQWLNSSLSTRVDLAANEATDPKVKTVVIAIELLGRALLSLIKPASVADVLYKISEALTEKELNIIHDVIVELTTVSDTNEKKMVELVDKLWTIVEPPSGEKSDDGAESDEKDEDESDEKEKSDSEDSKDSDDSDDSEDGDPDEEGDPSEDGDPSDEDGDEEGEGDGEGDPSDEEGSGEGDPSEGSGEGSEPGEGEGSGDPSDGEGSGDPSDGEGSGEPSDGEGSGEGSGSLDSSDIRDAINKARETSAEASKEIQNEKLEELIELAEELMNKDLSDKPTERFPEKETDKLDSEPENDESSGHGRSYSGQGLGSFFRPPNSTETACRRRMADRIRKAQWRDREIIKHSTYLPPGKLNSREAIRGDAQRSRGQIVTAKPWKTRKHRTVETPKARVGVLIDASGSMGPHIDGFSSAAWSTIAAVRDTGGLAVGVAFGESAFIIDKASRHASKLVAKYPADHGMEAISDALDVAIRELDLYDTKGSIGPKIVVIFSDGHWVDSEQSRAADFKLKKLQKAGVGIVVVAAGGFAPHPYDEIMELESAKDFNDKLGSIMVKAIKNA